MHAIWTIAKREFGSSFKSPVAYVVIVLFLGVTAGMFFYTKLFAGQTASMTEYFVNMPLFLLFFCPALAMRLLAEERGSGTLEMLLTNPVRDAEVVIGKFAGALGVVVVMLLLSLPFAVTVSKLGPLDWGPVIGAYFGTLLLAATYLAVGTVASAMTRSQIIAFIVGLSVCLLLWLMGIFYPVAGDTIGPVLEYLSPAYQFGKLSRGVVELRNVVYYLSAIGILLVLATQVLESRKWAR
jgi:gliding motility-associated transport system permease protein